MGTGGLGEAQPASADTPASQLIDSSNRKFLSAFRISRVLLPNMEPSLPDNPPDDALLLRRYLREGSEAAFRALAERHLPLVWSVARRVVHGDAALAADIAQDVLADFAMKAATLPLDMPPAGWLHRHTVFTATKVLRSESRRRARERAAAPPTDAMPAPDSTWSDLAPHLDPALDRLREPDRQALLLRFYEQRPLREVSRALGTTEEAARKRIDRALAKLRTHLSRRGIAPALVIFAALLRDESIAAPSAGLARRIAAGAWQRVEGGELSATAALPWWRTRRAWMGAAAAVAVIALIVLAWSGDFFGGAPPSRGGVAAALQQGKRVAPAPAEDFPPVTITATLMTLPEQEVAASMLNYIPGDDDAALYRQLFPRAADLQKLVKAEATFASTGHPLVVLTGPAKPSRAAFAPKAPPAPAPADPFAEPEQPPPPLSVSLRQIHEYSYPTEYDYDNDNGHVIPSARSFRNAGTSFQANVSPPDVAGNMLIECLLDHLFAPPEQEAFVTLPFKEGVTPDGENSFHQPVFRSTQWNLGTCSVAANAIVLAGMMNLPPEILPAGDKAPRRLLLFLQIKP